MKANIDSHVNELNMRGLCICYFSAHACAFLIPLLFFNRNETHLNLWGSYIPLENGYNRDETVYLLSDMHRSAALFFHQMYYSKQQ